MAEALNTSPVKVAILGDSLTASEWPTYLQTALGSQVQISAHGEPGATLTRDGYEPITESAPYDALMQSTPDIVLIMLGTNDTRPVVSDDTRAMIREDMVALVRGIEALPSAPMVTIITPPPLDNAPNMMGDRLIDQVLPALRAAADEAGVSLIDLNAAINDYPTNYPDGIHPNVAGKLSIARLMERPVQELVEISGWEPGEEDWAVEADFDSDVIPDEPQEPRIFLPSVDDEPPLLDAEDGLAAADLVTEGMFEGFALVAVLVAVALSGAVIL